MANGYQYQPQTQFEQYVCDKLQHITDDMHELRDAMATHCAGQQDYGELRVKINSMWKWVTVAVGGSGLLGAITGWMTGGGQ